jgi:formiminotetrahydrofolate cyclodeaminase
LRQELLTLASADAEALLRLGEALALPRTSDSERQLRERRKRAALQDAAEIQRDVLAGCAELAALGAAMVERGLRSAQADAATAVFLAVASARSAARAVATNLEGEPADSEFAGVARAVPQKLAEAEEAERAALHLLGQPTG